MNVKRWQIVLLLLWIVGWQQPVDFEVITAANANRLVPLALLSRGRALQSAWAGDDLFIVATNGLWRYSDLDQPPERVSFGPGKITQIKLNWQQNIGYAEIDHPETPRRWFALDTLEPVDLPYRGLPTFSADGSIMAVDNLIVNFATGTVNPIALSDLFALIFQPGQTAISSDNRLVALYPRFCAGCAEDPRINGVMLFDVATGVWLRTLTVPEEFPEIREFALTFSPDSQDLIAGFGSVLAPNTEYVSGSLDLLYWSITSIAPEIGQTRNLTAQLDDFARQMAFSPDGQYLAVTSSTSSGGNQHVSFYDVVAGHMLGSYAGEDNFYAFNDSRAFALTTRADVVTMTEVNGTAQWEFSGFANRPDPFNPDHWHGFQPEGAAAIQQWQAILESQPQIVTPDNLPGPWVAVSPDFQHVAAFRGNGDDLDVLITDAALGEEVVSFRTNQMLNDFSHLAFSRDGQYVIVDNCDRSYPSDLPYQIEIWDWALKELVASLDDRATCTFMFGDDYSPVETVDSQGEVVFWQPETQAAAEQIGGEWQVFQVNMPGDVIASGSAAGEVGLWDSTTGEPLIVLNGHTEEVVWLAFNPEGTLLFTAQPYGQGFQIWGVPGERIASNVQNPPLSPYDPAHLLPISTSTGIG